MWRAISTRNEVKQIWIMCSRSNVVYGYLPCQRAGDSKGAAFITRANRFIRKHTFSTERAVQRYSSLTLAMSEHRCIGF